MSSRRKPRKLSRETPVLRDTRLFVVATEDMAAPQQYFDQFRLTRVQIKVLPTLDKNSAATYVLERLKDYRNQYALDEDDVLWILLDTDHFTQGTHLRNYTGAIKEALQSNIRILINNPCFDFWLFLHVADIQSLHDGFSCQDISTKLRADLGSFSKTNVDTAIFSLSSLPQAYRAAEALDDQQLIPQSPGAQVYRLIKEILQSEPLAHLPDELQELATAIRQSG